MGKRKTTNKLIIGSLVFFLVVGSLWGVPAPDSSGMGTVYAASKGKVYLKKTSGTVKQGKTLKLTIKKQKGVKIVKKTFTSSKKKVATVSSSGKIKGVKPGKATIKVKVTYKIGKNAKQYKKTLKYTVKVEKKGGSTSDSTTEDASESDTNTIYPVTIKPSQEVYTVKEGETIQLSATVTRHPKNPNQAVNLEWSSTAVGVTVTTDGKVTGRAHIPSITQGFIVRVTDTVSGSSATCRVKVDEGDQYQAKYTYDAYVFGDYGYDGSQTVYVKTNNPNYVGFVIAIVGEYSTYIVPNLITQGLNDVSYIDENEGRVDGGYLRTWGTTKEKLDEISAVHNGKVTLAVLEVNPNALSSSSNKYRYSEPVWTTEVDARDYEAELDAWLLKQIASCTTSDMDKDEQMSAIAECLRSQLTYPRFYYTNPSDGSYLPKSQLGITWYTNKIIATGEKPVLHDYMLLSEYCLPLWERKVKELNSSASPILLERVGELIDYPVVSTFGKAKDPSSEYYDVFYTVPHDRVVIYWNGELKEYTACPDKDTGHLDFDPFTTPKIDFSQYCQ